jgi:fluoride ion exporter CrcB/FEX
MYTKSQCTDKPPITQSAGYQARPIDDVRLEMKKSNAPINATTEPLIPDKNDEIYHNGWTKKARNLVKLWMGQTALNRRYHHKEGIRLQNRSTKYKFCAAICGSIATFLSVVNAALAYNETSSLVLSIIVGFFAALTTLSGVLAAIQHLDEESEKHRQTSIQYARLSNEAQSVLVEENEENLPKATDFLKKMTDVSNIIQLFGPALDNDNADIADLPSMILMKAATGGSRQHQNDQSGLITSEYNHIYDKESDSVSQSDEAAPTGDDRRKARLRRYKEIVADDEAVKQEQVKLDKERLEIETLKNLVTRSAHELRSHSPQDGTSSRDNVIHDGISGSGVVRVGGAGNRCDFVRRVQDDKLAHGSNSDAFDNIGESELEIPIELISSLVIEPYLLETNNQAHAIAFSDDVTSIDQDEHRHEDHRHDDSEDHIHEHHYPHQTHVDPVVQDSGVKNALGRMKITKERLEAEIKTREEQLRKQASQLRRRVTQNEQDERDLEYERRVENQNQIPPQHSYGPKIQHVTDDTNDTRYMSSDIIHSPVKRTIAKSSTRADSPSKAIGGLRRMFGIDDDNKATHQDSMLKAQYEKAVVLKECVGLEMSDDEVY